MQEIIADTRSDELLANMDSNMVAFYAPYGRGNGNTFHQTPSVAWFYTGIPDPLLNGVLFSRLKPAEVKPIFEGLQAKIDWQGAPALWWIGPQSKPDNLGSLLEQYGLHFDGEVPGMAMDLALLDERPQTIPGFTVRTVENTAMQTLWAQIVAVGNGFSEAAVDGMVRVEPLLADPQYKTQRRYIGFLNETPVATSALVLDSGLAGIYGVATLAEARRKGIGRFMTVMALLEARQMGYRIGILQASSMGYPIYAQIGFKDVCKYRLYLQSASDRPAKT